MRLESLAAVAVLSMPLLAGVASVASLNYGFTTIGAHPAVLRK